MLSNLSLPTTDPAQLLRFRDRQFAAELLAVAIVEFDLFSWIKRNEGVDSQAIAREFQVHARPLDVLLTLSRASGLIRTDSTGAHYLTKMGEEYLVVGSPWFLGPYYQPLRGNSAYDGFVRVLRTGKPANWQAKAGGNDWHESMLDPEFAKSFTELMNCRGITFGQYLAEALEPHLKMRRRVLDVGGGSGIYAIALAARYPQVEAQVLEQPPVDRIANGYIRSMGMEGRVSVVSMDMFAQQWPASDVILLSNVLHDWDIPEVRQLLAKASQSLSAGGMVVIHDAFIDDDKSGPLPVAEYSATLAHITQGKCYSAQEYRELLSEFGIVAESYQATIGDRGFLVAFKK
jgi:predicted nicotinamide N-methyase